MEEKSLTKIEDFLPASPEENIKWGKRCAKLLMDVVDEQGLSKRLSVKLQKSAV